MTKYARHWLQVGSIALLSVNMAGCFFGSASIAAGRSVYNEVITRTEDEELLNMLVRDRYGETAGMLAVASVTANIRASASFSAQLGYGPAEDFAGNLVPLSGGAAFEENPTITYIPLGGDEFVQRLLNPLTIEEALLMAQYMRQRRDIYMLIALESINGVQNPAFTANHTGSGDFQRMVEIVWVLRHAGALRFAHDADDHFLAVFESVDAEHQQYMIELLELAGISKRPSGGRLVLPMQAAVGWSDGAINLQTRSVLDILRSAGNCIDIPEPHLRAGVVEPHSPTSVDRLMQIRSSRVRPGGVGTIAISYRGWWYYIDDADPASKRAFAYLRMLVGLRLLERGKDKAAPVLTIPVG
jgi:hypothetical protein